MSPQLILAVVSLLDHIVLAVRLGPKAKRDYDNLSAKVRSMVDNERDPTEAEWADLGRAVESASARLRAAAALLDE